MMKNRNKLIIKVVAKANTAIPFPAHIKQEYDEERKINSEIASGNSMLNALDGILKNLSELVTLPNGTICHKNSISKHGYNMVGCGE